MQKKTYQAFVKVTRYTELVVEIPTRVHILCRIYRVGAIADQNGFGYRLTFYVCRDVAPSLYHYADVTINGLLHEQPRLLHIPRPVTGGLSMRYEACGIRLDSVTAFAIGWS